MVGTDLPFWSFRKAALSRCGTTVEDAEAAKRNPNGRNKHPLDNKEVKNCQKVIH